MLADAGVPTGPVLSVPDALNLPQIRERGMIATFDDCPGVGRDIQIMRPGFKVNGETPSVDAPPPQLGQDTEQILASLGYAPREIDVLREQGAI